MGLKRGVVRGRRMEGGGATNEADAIAAATRATARLARRGETRLARRGEFARPRRFGQGAAVGRGNLTLVSRPDERSVATPRSAEAVNVVERRWDAAAGAASRAMAIRAGEQMRVLARPPLLIRLAENSSTASATLASSRETLRVAAMTADAPSASRAGAGAGAGAEVVMQEGGVGRHKSCVFCGRTNMCCVARTTATEHVANTEAISWPL